jgi:hypothetical protein
MEAADASLNVRVQAQTGQTARRGLRRFDIPGEAAITATAKAAERVAVVRAKATLPGSAEEWRSSLSGGFGLGSLGIFDSLGLGSLFGSSSASTQLAVPSSAAASKSVAAAAGAPAAGPVVRYDPNRPHLELGASYNQRVRRGW